MSRRKHGVPARWPLSSTTLSSPQRTLARLQRLGIPYRSSVRGPQDLAISTAFGGRGVYWNDPEAHQWEMLTVSYARRASEQAR